jgi:murein DD-endopeptidase MepM/ murein hydrolase activator NlpD
MKMSMLWVSILLMVVYSYNEIAAENVNFQLATLNEISNLDEGLFLFEDTLSLEKKSGPEHNLTNLKGEIISIITFQEQYEIFCQICEQMGFDPVGIHLDLMKSGTVIGDSISLPVRGEYWISSGWGSRKHPLTGKKTFHHGIDFASLGGAYTINDGIVASIGQDDIWGEYIAILHLDGNFSFYAHLKSENVEVGQVVARGQKIGMIGNTGSSTNTHLHFALFQIKEIKQNKMIIKGWLNPTPLLKGLMREDVEIVQANSQIPLGMGGK